MSLPSPPSDRKSGPAPSFLAAHSPMRWLQARLAHRLGVGLTEQERTVRAMQGRDPSDTATYWLQLILSMCIATFGLVLNSSGVVIGAMLIAPLMGPIVALAMALTVGSPYLALRSLLRIVTSIVVVVSGSALINLALPYHEVTAEIAARTTPTALDLFVAVFCAFAAAFSVVRSSSETIATAAGTSISIALVPPLCVVGFGVGNAQWSVALGAALLFTANLSAILMFAALFFLGLGFNLVKPATLEEQAAEENTNLGRLLGGLRRLFGHRYGTLVRVLLPLSLVAAVYIPLSRALSAVAWEVRVRGQVQSILDLEIPHERAVQNTLLVKRGQISLRIVLVAKPARAHELEARLRLRIAQVSGVEPVIHVLAVPDEQAVRDTALALSTPHPAPLPPLPEPDLFALQRLFGERLLAEWPKGAAGALLDWRLGSDKGGAVVEVTHLGPPLGAAAEQLLARRLDEALHGPVRLQDRALDGAEHEVSLDDEEKLWRDLLAAMAAVRAQAGLGLCLWLPKVELSKTASPTDLQHRAVVAAMRTAGSTLGTRVTILEAEQPRLRVSQQPCAPAASYDVPLPKPPER